MSEIKKLFDECFGELASDLPSKVFIRKLQDIILSGRPKKKECVCDAMTLDAWGCDCGARVFNIACDEYDNWIKECLL